MQTVTRVTRGLGRVGSIIGSLIFSLLCILFGLIWIFVIGKEGSQERRYVESLPVVTAAGFNDTPVGQDVVISGVFDRNKEYEGGLVLYKHQSWEIEYDSDDGWEGDWETYAYMLPSVQIWLGDGHVATSEVGSVTIGGQPHDVVLERGTGRKVEGYEEGTTRVSGFTNGDTVTVVGSRDASGRLTPQRFYGGDRQALIKNLRTGETIGYVVGGILIAGAVIIPLIALLGMITRRIR